MENLNSSLDTLFTKMEGFVSSKTVVGEPLNVGQMVIVPLVDIVVGVGAGSGASGDKNGAGGGGLGAKINPSAVIIIKGDSVQMINVKNQDSVNKLIDMVPGIVSKLNFGPFKTEYGAESEVEEVTFPEKVFIEPEDSEDK